MYEIRFSCNFCRVFSKIRCVFAKRRFKIVVVYLAILVVDLAKPFFLFWLNLLY